MNLLPLPKRFEVRPGLLSKSSQAPTLRRQGITGHGPQSYILLVNPSGVTLQAQDEAGFYYAEQSLKQLWRQAKSEGLPCCKIEDWPDFLVRGLSLDVSRCRVPKMEWLFGFIDELAGLKYNQLQLYIEHTFEFSKHPLIGKNCSSLTGAEIRQIDAYCRERFIELVPSFASFGHFHDTLTLPPYRHLAEDLGVGTYVKSTVGSGLPTNLKKGWTLAPGREQSYTFLGQLYSELLPNFSSQRFNPCCDEPYDLGWGQSAEAVAKLGRGEVFARHVKSVRALSETFGKAPTMLWSDVLHTHPEVLKKIPKDTIILDWQYGDHSPFDKIKNFTDAGFETWACPSTNSWGTLFPRLPMAMANIDRFSEAALKHGATGFLTTIWGDGGHFNMPECEWPGIVRGAERGWNVAAPAKNFSKRFCQGFLGISAPAFSAALDTLGNISTALQHGGMGSFWADLLFAEPGDKIFKDDAKIYYRAENGKMIAEGGNFDSRYVQDALESLAKIRPEFENAFAASDRLNLAKAWIYSVDAISCAAEKWLNKKSSDGKMKELKDRFSAMWRACSRESEIQFTLNRFDKAA